MNRSASIRYSLLVGCVVASLMSCGKDDDDAIPLGPTLPATGNPVGSSTSTSSDPLAVRVEWRVAAAPSVVAGNNQQSYLFTARVTGGAAPYTYRWDFGDGTSAVEGNPVTHKFYAPGTYVVFVTVRDADGKVARSNAGGDLDIEIDASPFSVACYVTPTQGEAPLQVELRAEPTGNVGPITWNWDFGDGADAGQRIVSHTYDPLGNGGEARFTATARATDGLGRSVQCSRQIVVSIPNSIPKACLHEWTSSCVSGTITAIAIGTDGCLENIAPLPVTPPAGEEYATVRNFSSTTYMLHLGFAGGFATSFPFPPTATFTADVFCPPAGNLQDGPVSFSW